MCVNYTRRGKYPYWRMIQLWHFNYAMKKTILLKNAQMSNHYNLNPFKRTGPNGKMLDLWRKSFLVWIFMSSLWTTNWRILTNQKSRRLSKEWNSRSLIPLCVNNKRLANTPNEWSKFSILNRHWRNCILQKAQTVIQTCLIPSNWANLVVTKKAEK